MKRIVRLTESDLVKLVKRVISEQQSGTNEPYPGTQTDPKTGQKIVPPTYQGTQVLNAVKSGKNIPQIETMPLLTNGEGEALKNAGYVKLIYVFDKLTDNGDTLKLEFQALKDFNITKGGQTGQVKQNQFLKTCDGRRTAGTSCTQSRPFNVQVGNETPVRITPTV